LKKSNLGLWDLRRVLNVASGGDWLFTKNDAIDMDAIIKCDNSSSCCALRAIADQPSNSFIVSRV